MKFFKDKLSFFIKVGLSTIVILFLIFAPISIMPTVIKEQSFVTNQRKFQYQGILELWHIESFEGGSMSRYSFLEKQALLFEKKHNGTYVVINNMNIEQLKASLSIGKFPNLLSFGVGVGDTFIKELVDLNYSGIRSDLLKGGCVNANQYAIPYILGGYLLITDQENKESKNISGVCGTSTNMTILPLKAIKENKIKVESFYKDSKMDSYTVYDKYLKGYFSNLLGTQRDLFRILNRQRKSLTKEKKYLFLNKWTDLVQYISIFKTNSIAEQMSKKFIEQLISDESQSEIKNINMFSVKNNIKLYNSGPYNEFEEKLKENMQIQNVFTSEQLLYRNRNILLNEFGVINEKSV